MTTPTVGQASLGQQPFVATGEHAPWIGTTTVPEAPSSNRTTDFFVNDAERSAHDQRTLQLVESLTRQEEAKARQEEAKTERAKAGTGAALPPPADPAAITLEFAMSSDTASVRLEYLLDPYLPRGCVVCFAGRGGTAKSSFIATIAAHLSSTTATLWVSVEEPKDWIKARHTRAGGVDGTLAVVTAIAAKTDQNGRAIPPSFNIYEHLEPAILKAQAAFAATPRPLKLVVLDTAVGLTNWSKGESPNDDASVKRLLGYLQGLAEKHDLTIAFAHSNKGKHDYFADTVAGASAWTNSPRLSFVHAADRREDYAYVVRVAKTNLTAAFATTYKTQPVHVLYHREEGTDSVLCRVVPGPVVWGEEASMALFEEATRKPKDDDGDQPDNSWRPPSADEKVLQKVVELALATTEPVTRDTVQQHFLQSIHGRVWKRVDEALLMRQLEYRIAVQHGQQNKTFYQRMPPAVHPAP